MSDACPHCGGVLRITVVAYMTVCFVDSIHVPQVREASYCDDCDYVRLVFKKEELSDEQA